MALIDDLDAAVTAQPTAERSMIELLNRVADAVSAAGSDAPRLQAIVDLLHTEGTRLVAAVNAGQPSAEAPTFSGRPDTE